MLSVHESVVESVEVLEALASYVIEKLSEGVFEGVNVTSCEKLCDGKLPVFGFDTVLV